MTTPPPPDGTRAKLQYHVQQKDGYGGQVFLYGVVLGFERGTWPVQAFAADADGGCDMGARWAAQNSENRVLVGPIPIPDDVPVRFGQKVPEKYILTGGE